ncbi:zinc-finger homeodomain protein 7-like [Diospyros lotus]|uniref:zinc-finger homeodomain protein 7-like n=1 Tax=Diospyros lotus TaxID=55363 RepID=UPI00225985C6|nr:zinc-finger homeodomain protein 7-like [Diospyros lotus]
MSKHQKSVRKDGGSSKTAGAVRYAECCKNHGLSRGQSSLTDGCMEFLASKEDSPRGASICDACGCHRSFHKRKVAGAGEARYDDCRKNHTLHKSSYAIKDGCMEFVAGTQGAAIFCAGCGCHRSFHKRNDEEAEPSKPRGRGSGSAYDSEESYD